MDTRAKELVRIGTALFAKKRQWDELCQEIAENFYPLRADFTQPFTLGEDFSLDLMDSYPVQARETLGTTPSAMLRQGNWFNARTGMEEIDEQPDVARWLESATLRLRRLVYDRRANFVRATNEADHDWVTFGNPVLSVEEDMSRTHFLFRSWHPKDCAWMENVSGRIDHLQRSMPMTARNMKMRWAKTIHQDVTTAAEKDPTTEFKVRHIALPFDELYGDDKAKRRQYKNAQYCSVYIDVDHEMVLGEAPLPVFSYVVPRWRTLSGVPFAFSPATITALPDGRMLQSLARIILEQGEKALDPPLVAKGEMFRDAVNLYAGGLTYVDLESDQDIRDALMPVETSKGMSVGLDMKADVRNLIAEAFLLNKLMLPNVREMREIEVQARLDEFRRAALPFFGPIESEYHLPLLDTAMQMAIHNRAFDFKEMPDVLKQGVDVGFSFDSPLTTAEGRQAVAAFQESIQIIAGAAQFDQTVTTMMDIKVATKDAVKGTGAKADWFNDEETEQAATDQQNAAGNLMKMATYLRGGAQVAGDVANATLAMKQAGIAA